MKKQLIYLVMAFCTQLHFILKTKLNAVQLLFVPHLSSPCGTLLDDLMLCAERSYGRLNKGRILPSFICFLRMVARMEDECILMQGRRSRKGFCVLQLNQAQKYFCTNLLCQIQPYNARIDQGKEKILMGTEFSMLSYGKKCLLDPKFMS